MAGLQKAFSNPRMSLKIGFHSNTARARNRSLIPVQDEPEGSEQSGNAFRVSFE
jgi:hypothetical protein